MDQFNRLDFEWPWRHEKF